MSLISFLILVLVISVVALISSIIIITI